MNPRCRMPLTAAAEVDVVMTVHRCPCGRRVGELLWVVKGTWFCSQTCGYAAAYKAQPQDVPQPTSQARYPRIMASGTLR